MGHGASLLAVAAKADPNILHHSREEMSALFAKEYASFASKHLTEEEAKVAFMNMFKNQEVDILKNIAKQHGVEEEAKSEAINSGMSREEKQRAMTEASGHNTSFMLQKKAQTFLCCVDGSDAADAAFKTVLHMKRKYDHVCVFHAYSEEKGDSLLAALRPDAVRQRYEDQLISVCKRPYFSMHFEERFNRTPLRVLKDLLDFYRATYFSRELVPTENRPDFVVLGHYGRKGPKANPMLLGSTTDIALRTLLCPVIVVKRVVPVGPRYYVFAVDFSSNSKKGLDILLSLVTPRDTLRLICIRHPSGKEKSSDTAVDTDAFNNKEYYYYDNELQENGPSDSAFTYIDVSNEVTVAQAILDHVSGPHMPDFLAIAPRALAEEGINANTEHIIANSPTSVILCKN